MKNYTLQIVADYCENITEWTRCSIAVKRAGHATPAMQERIRIARENIDILERVYNARKHEVRI